VKNFIICLCLGVAAALIGYRLVSRNAAPKAEATQSWKAKVSAFSSRARETDREPCQAADQSNICERYARGELICATGNRNVPFGTRLHVPGYGICTVADRMNKRYDGTGAVDVYFGRDTRTALVWGSKSLQISKM
jgi:3D (Asp-Asp-Asp) domain-containing protein